MEIPETRFKEIKKMFKDSSFPNDRRELEKIYFELSIDGKHNQDQSDTVRVWIPVIKHLLDVAWEKEKLADLAESQNRKFLIGICVSVGSVVIAIIALAVPFFTKSEPIPQPLEVEVVPHTIAESEGG